MKEINYHLLFRNKKYNSVLYNLIKSSNFENLENS